MDTRCCHGRKTAITTVPAVLLATDGHSNVPPLTAATTSLVTELALSETSLLMSLTPGHMEPGSSMLHSKRLPNNP